MAVNEQDIEKLLLDTFTSVIGKPTKVFFAHGFGPTRRYNCQCCHINNMGETSVWQHANGKKHKLVLKEFNTRTRPLSECQGANVPDPGASPLQNRINEIKNQAIVGLEYVIEVHLGSNFECVYHCVLCESKFDPTTIISHLTAYNHRLQYLEKHFPTAFKEISDLDSTEKRKLKSSLTETVCEGIEDHFGRLRYLMVDNSEFVKDRMQSTEKVLNSKHIDEYMGCTFIDLIRDCIRDEQDLSDVSDIEEGEVRSRRASLDAISTSSESYSAVSVISLSSSSRSVDLTTLSPSSDSEKSASESIDVQQQTLKMDRIKLLMENVEVELKKKYDEYKDKPTSHPDYNEEWVLFWRRRYKELKADGQPTDTHDFKTEWNVEWKELMERRGKTEAEMMQKKICAKLTPLKKRGKKSKSEKRSRKEKHISKCRKRRSSTRKSSSAKKKRSRSHERTHRRLTSPKNNSPSPLRIRSPRRNRRSPLRSRSPRRNRRSPHRSRSSHSPRESRSPRRNIHSPRGSHTPRRWRSPRRSRSPQSRRSPRSNHSTRRTSPRKSRSPMRRPHSPRRSGSPHQRHINKSRSPTHTQTRRSHLQPNNRNSETTPSHEKKESSKIPTAKQSEPPRSSIFPWKRPERSSMSPQKSQKTMSTISAGTSVTNRRNTSYFAMKPPQKDARLCVPIPPRMILNNSKLTTETNVNDDSEPLTIISVLGLLTALEDILGSLGPKVIGLMIQAKAMDRAEENSSCQLLDNHESCILFETIKEKLKGLTSAGLVASNKMNAVKKTIKNMETLIQQTNEKEKACEKLQEVGVRKPFPRTEHPREQEQPQPQQTQQQKQQKTASQQVKTETTSTSSGSKDQERKVIKAKLSAALIEQGRSDITEEQLDAYVESYFLELEKKRSESKMAKNNCTALYSTKSDGGNISTVPDQNRVKTVAKLRREDVEAARSVPSSSSSCRPVELPLNCPTTTSTLRSILPKPVSTQANQIPAAKYDSRLSNEKATVATVTKPVVSMPTLRDIPIAKPVPKMYPKRTTDSDEVTTLSDQDLRTLMTKFSSLSDGEKDNYMTYMKKLKADDPVRYNRLQNENEKPEEQKPSSTNPLFGLNGATGGRPTTNRTNSQTVFSPGDNIASDGEHVTTKEIVIDSDSDGSDDSEDSATLASSIANTQQQIAQMNRNLNPINSGNKIPVISSPMKVANVHTQPQTRMERLTFPGQQAMFRNSIETPATTHQAPPLPIEPPHLPAQPPSLPALPQIQYPQQHRLPQTTAYPDVPLTFQQQYQQHHHPIPSPYTLRPFFNSPYQPPAFPPYYPPR